MSWLKRLRSLRRPGRLDSELEEELRAHVEMRTQDNLAAGMSREAAERDARLRFGNATLVKEDTRAMDIVVWIEALGQNLGYAARMLRRSPGFTAVAILTLALGIGANVATFTIVHAVLLSPLPFPHPEQLVRVFDDLKTSNTQDVGLSAPELWDLRDRSGVFEDLSAIWQVDANLTGAEHPERVELMVTGANYFLMLGAKPQIGRVYTPQDTQPGFSEGVVLSDAFWKRTFGADPHVVGRQIRMDSDLYTILGVMPPDFQHPGRALATGVDVWGTANFNAPPFPTPPRRAIRMIPGVIARLKPGIGVAQAQARLDAFSSELTKAYPVEYPAAAGWKLRLVDIQEDLVGNVRTELLVLLGAVGFVLLIACVNLANLLLARSMGRQREIAVRLAIGASRARLIGQLLTESILLAAISGGFALLAVVWLKAWLLQLAPADLPRLQEAQISTGVLLFAMLLSLLTGVLFGLAPAWQAGQADQIDSLREAGRGSNTGRRKIQVSRVLVASEIALSLGLLVGAGLLMRSFWRLTSVQPGFDAQHLVTAQIWLSVPNDPNQNPYRTADKRAALYREIVRRVSQLPGVERAALGSPNSMPLGSARFRQQFTIENRAMESDQAPVAEIATVSPEYFDVLRIPLVRGRGFRDTDTVTGPLVVIVNAALAHRYWPGEEALGKAIKTNAAQPQSPWATIVGIVGDVKSEGLDIPSTPSTYFSTSQGGFGLTVFVRTNNDPATIGDQVRAQVQAIDPNIPVFGVRTMEQVTGRYLAERRFALKILGVFAGMAMLLAVIGIYGVMAYTLTQRTKEIGIRMALGAQSGDIFRIAVGEGTRTLLFGLSAGLLASLALTRYLRSMLFEVSAADPLTFGGIAALLAAVTFVACAVPARRATRVDPLVALRHE